jgi:zinc transport system substrate-binding protein
VRIVLVLVSVVGALAATACGGSGGDERQRTVIAAFYPLAFAAEQIAGDAVDVVNLTPPGVEPHDVELSPRDVERLRSAEVVLYLGAGFQPAVEKAVEDAEGEAVDVVADLELREAPDRAHHDEGEEEEADEEHALDPHVWLDPLEFAAVATRIGRTLDDPEGAERLASELRALDDEFESGLADCERREIVTSHAAFGYLAARYGLRQIAITGVTPEAEPSARDLEEVVEEVRMHRASTIFFETLVSPRLGNTVARETGLRTDTLNPLEGLTEEQASRGEDYFSVMRENLTALRRALDCR